MDVFLVKILRYKVTCKIHFRCLINVFFACVSFHMFRVSCAYSSYTYASLHIFSIMFCIFFAYTAYSLHIYCMYTLCILHIHVVCIFHVSHVFSRMSCIFAYVMRCWLRWPRCWLRWKLLSVLLVFSCWFLVLFFFLNCLTLPWNVNSN